MYSSLKFVSTVLLFVCFTSGCAHLGESGGGKDLPAYFEGSWYGPHPDNALGVLNCTITPTGDGQWDALFFATFGGQGEYEVELNGTTVDDTIVFKGSVDLGATSGGVFDWTGVIEGDNFDGSYTSKFINGTCKMTRAEKPVV